MAQGSRSDSRLAFIVGCPRSGTTWTWGLLNAHPDTEALVPADLGQDDPSPETAVFMTLKDHEARAVIDKKLDEHPGKLIIEKTPWHANQINRIWKLYPSAKIIFVRRDPRATINSMLLNGQASGTPSAWGLQKSIRIYGRMRGFWNDHKDDARVHTVRYEDLSKTPHLTYAKMLSFLGLPSDREIVETAVSANHMTPAFVSKGVLRKGTVDSFKEELPQGEIDLISRLFRDDLAVA